MAKKILAIGAHPDDVEQFMGGTLLLLAKAGHEVTIAAMTDGACGTTIESAEAITKTRRKESETAAKLLGAKGFGNLGIRDGSIEYSLENVKKLVTLIREVNPDIILTHPAKDDYMTDHWHTGALVLWAIPESRHKNFVAEADHAPVNKPIHLYHCDPQGLVLANGQIAPVNTIIDITQVIDAKVKAFKAHASQLEFMNAHKDVQDTVWETKRWHVIRGAQVTVEYAEGFQQQLQAHYPRKNLLANLLEEHAYTL